MMNSKEIIAHRLRTIDTFDRVKNIELMNKLYWWWFTSKWYKQGPCK